MTPDQAASYKARKEAFVSNLSGSSLTEINLVTLVASAAVLLWTALQKRQSLFTPYTPIALAADFLLNVCAILFATTLYSSAPLVLSIFLITPAVLLLTLTPASSNPNTKSRANGSTTTPSKSKSKDQTSTANDAPLLPVRPFLTHYRGSMMIVTCLSILSVDFRIFPRRFAKVETWGTSLMDLGVGSFVFSAGLVSARALLKSSSPNKSSFTARFVTSIRHSIPLLVLGLIRLWSVKGLDYAEHVTEYGVHWNFFFTLALLPPFVEIADTLVGVPRRMLGASAYDVLAVLLAITYEILLNIPELDLRRYILVSPRGPDWLSKNREGVFSFIGYLAIFLAGRGCGADVVQFGSKVPLKASPKDADQPWFHATRLERRIVLRTLAIRAAVYTALFILSTHYIGFNLSVSRRLANSPYVTWVAAFNNAQLFLFALVEACGPAFSYSDSESVRFATSRILRVFNNNGLVIFLLANLLTGLVNLTVNTLDMSPLGAMGVLMVYAAAVTGVALGLDHTGIKIKI
ncbi:phosphatidylinositol glycan, class W [Exophiala viscosa]|uniref:GPI-anchored wall transfer protein n=1 Tax=Exophiala viscosa TaxID=2486360 RepID=A0AAN6DR09_9EURO|nr:phosphatidylinositol glycan, class W [Exophiala viscosa]KAI1619681.1 phosphatidylinositol glycan, class W [Exophiala viscosa]